MDMISISFTLRVHGAVMHEFPASDCAWPLLASASEHLEQAGSAHARADAHGNDDVLDAPALAFD